jgi:hypothetical protein
MLVVGTKDVTPKKWIVVTFLLLLGAFQAVFLSTALLVALFTIHVGVKPSAMAPGGFRVFGFPRRGK